MIQLYEVLEEATGLKLFCRVKKQTLTLVSECKTLWLKLYWDGDQAIVLEEFQIQLHLITAKKVREILNPCLTLGFYSFPQAISVDLPYSWNLVSGEHSTLQSWFLGTNQIACASLPKLQLKIHNLLDTCIIWDIPEVHASNVTSILFC